MKSNISNLSKVNKHDIMLNILKINIKLLLKNLFIIKLINIKPMTNPLNNHYDLILKKDKIKKNKTIKNYIVSAPKKNHYYIIIPIIL